MVSYGIGASILGSITDKIGRKKIIMLAILMLSLFHTSSSFAETYIGYACLQWSAGKIMSTYILIKHFTYISFLVFWGVGLFCAPFVMTVEIVGHEYAALCSIFMNIPFVIGELLMVAISYFFRDFRMMLKVAFIPPVFCLGNFILNYIYMYVWHKNPKG